MQTFHSGLYTSGLYFCFFLPHALSWLSGCLLWRLLCLVLYCGLCPVQVDAVGVSIKELQTQAGSFQKDVGKVKGNIAAADTQLETIRSSRAALLESATLEQVGGGQGAGAQGHVDIIVSLLLLLFIVHCFIDFIVFSNDQLNCLDTCEWSPFVLVLPAT